VRLGGRWPGTSFTRNGPGRSILLVSFRDLKTSFWSIAAFRKGDSKMTTTKSIDRKTVLSALWIFVMFNYLYADLAMTIFQPGIYQKAAAEMGGGVVLGATALMEVLIAMVLLSRILTYKANRWANVIGGVVGTAFVAVTMSPKMPPFYLFIASIEIACTLFIIWYAWTWRNPEGQS
jgi:hypothetical protein